VLYGGAALLVVEVCMLIYCSIDVLTTPGPAVRNLPKPLWLLLVLFFPILGGIAWLVAGRPPRSARVARPTGGADVRPEPDPPPRATAATPEDDEAFHRRLRERAEQQRRAAQQQRAQREQPDDGAG
jgi:hypothetical protein